MTRPTKAKGKAAPPTSRAVSNERIRITQRGPDTYIEVDRWPHPAAEQTISSCNVRRPDFRANQWSGASIIAGERLDDGGFEQGRLLCLWDRPALQHATYEMAFVTYSVAKGRFVVRRLEVSRGTHSDVAAEYKSYLLECLHQIAALWGSHGGKIFWETENQAQADDAANCEFKRSGSIFNRISGRQQVWERKPTKDSRATADEG